MLAMSYTGFIYNFENSGKTHNSEGVNKSLISISVGRLMATQIQLFSTAKATLQIFTVLQFIM